MTALRSSLNNRREEFDAHFSLAKALEDRVVLDSEESLGSISLSVRHINTIKSGLIVHLYNIEEATMSEILEHVGGALGAAEPRRWTEHSMKEWIREAVVKRISASNTDSQLAVIYETSHLLLKQQAPGPQKIGKPPGTWTDKAIAMLAKRMGVTFNLSADMWQRIAPTPVYGDKSPFEFLADRRNAIAHGRRSFENGARVRTQ